MEEAWSRYTGRKTSKTRLDADSRSQFPLARAFLPSNEESSYRGTISLCIRFPVCRLSRCFERGESDGFRGGKNKSWIETRRCKTPMLHEINVRASTSSPSFSFRPDVYCSSSSEFQLYEILSISRILWFSEIANRKHPVSSFSKNLPRICIFEGDRWNIETLAGRNWRRVLKRASRVCAWFNVESFSCGWQGKLSRLRSFKFEKLRAPCSQNIRSARIRPLTTTVENILSWKFLKAFERKFGEKRTRQVLKGRFTLNDWNLIEI